MSRVGRLPVPIADGVKCEVNDGTITVTGPKGALSQTLRPEITVEVVDGEVLVTRPNDAKQNRAYHGLTRALINNMVEGVTQGYSKTLQIEGNGYRASIQGKALNLSVGHSHPVSIDPPEGIVFEMEGQQTIKITGIDKQAVGQTAANVRSYRKPEPYKGKGIRYSDERVRRKVGKSGSK